MHLQKFLTSLAFVTLGTGAALALLHVLLPPMRSHWGFAVASVLLFVLVCVGLYFAGQSTLRSKSKVAFNGLISGSVFGKMLLAVVTLFVYQQSQRPDNQWFVAIFLLVYVVYTAFEVWFLTRLAKSG
jgi:hypothetical protein